MESIGKPIAAPRRNAWHIAGSVGAHGLILLGIAVMLHHAARWVAPYRLPGSENGHNFMVTYLPDRAPEQSASAKSKVEPKLADLMSPMLPLPTHKTRPSALPSTTTAASPNPDSTTGADALGSGNITLALTSYFPPPKPDLSALPHGTRGDVILDVVIDANGKISDLKMTSGLGYGIDESVIATVRQWTFHPAMQNGHPVASEQELLFHYERS